MATDLKSWASRQRAPFTLALAGSLILTALVGWVTQGRTLFILALAPGQPWGVVTFPWAFSPLGSLFGTFFLIILVAFLFQFGSSLEREMNTSRIAAFWFLATVVFGGVGLALGAFLSGPVLPGAALITLWCARNRSAQMMLWGIVPLSGTWMAALVAASVLFSFGAGNPLIGVVLALPLGLVWLYGLERLPIAFAGGGTARRAKHLTVVKGGTKYDDAYYENVKRREIEREEQERLRKLFEGK